MDFETFKNASVRFELKTGSIVLGIMLLGINLNLPVQLVGTACSIITLPGAYYGTATRDWRFHIIFPLDPSPATCGLV